MRKLFQLLSGVVFLLSFLIPVLCLAADAAPDTARVKSIIQLLKAGKNSADALGLLEELSSAANAGNVTAANALGGFLIRGVNGNLPMPQKGLALLEPLAAKENIGALNTLGDVYLRGALGLAPDAAKGRAYLEQAIALGNGGAAVRLAEGLIRGDAGVVDGQAGMKLLQDQIAVGNDAATLSLGNFYVRGALGLKIDVSQGLTLLKPLAAKDNTGALNTLGDVYLRGAPGLASDAAKGRAYLEQAIALGNGGAAVRLAEGLIRGDGGVVDGSAGLALLNDQVALKNSGAMLTLANALLRGSPGITRNPDMARMLLKESAELGNSSAEMRLSETLLTGIDLPQDTAEALNILNGLAKNNNMAAITRLGNLYLNGTTGVNANPSLARTYLERAVATGNASAATSLGNGFLFGKLGQPDALAARSAFETGAKMGDQTAPVQLAMMQIYGWAKTKRNPNKGFAALEILAEQGNQPALKAMIKLKRDGIKGIFAANDNQRDAYIAQLSKLSLPVDVEIERVLALASDAKTPAAFQAVQQKLRALPIDRQLGTATRIIGVNGNVATFIMQEAMRQTGTFNELSSGQLNSKTIRAIAQTCKLAYDRGTCGFPLTRETMLVVLGRGWSL